MISVSNAPGFRGIDILLSSLWPHDITNKVSSVVLPDAVKSLTASNGEVAIQSLALQLKPRYHFTSADVGVFWARTPYRNGITGHITRFIALGMVDHDVKDKSKKWMHALNLVPLTGKP